MTHVPCLRLVYFRVVDFVIIGSDNGKPLSKPMLAYYQFEHEEHSISFEMQMSWLKKYIWMCRLCFGLNVLTIGGNAVNSSKTCILLHHLDRWNNCIQLYNFIWLWFSVFNPWTGVFLWDTLHSMFPLPWQTKHLCVLVTLIKWKHFGLVRQIGVNVETVVKFQITFAIKFVE